MADGLNEIIARLEQQKSAIERALSALQEVGIAGSSAPAAAPRAAKRKGGMTPEGRARLIAALKKRWALKKANEAAAQTGAKRRGRPRKNAA